MDIFTREVDVVLGDNLTAQEGARCTKQILTKLGPCQIFQTDNGMEWGRECQKVIGKYARIHRRIHARRKNENAYIESFNRSLPKECLGWIKYKKEDKETLQTLIDQYLVLYHTRRPHLGLNLKTPAQVAMLHLR